MNITKVGCGEYFTVYLQADGKVGATLWDGSNHKYMLFPQITDAVDVVGGQYSCLALTKDGTVFELYQTAQGGPGATLIKTGIVYAQMFNQAKLLVDTAGDLYYLAETVSKDVMQLGQSAAPKLILRGYNIIKIVSGEDYLGMMLLTNDDSVLQWDRGKQSPYTKIASGIIDIAMVGRGAFIANTGKDLLAWGNRLNYITRPIAPAGSTVPISILSYWPTIQFPLKKMVGNWNTLHIIDANGDMYASGENVMGEVGNGKGWPSWNTYMDASNTKPQPFAWNWLPNQMVQAPTKLDGKWLDVFTSGNMAFHVYAIRSTGKLYSWGRDKKRALATGKTLKDNAANDPYPNWRDVWSPTEVDPINVSWIITESFDPKTAANNAPIIPLPPEPTPIPVPKILALISIGQWHFDLYDDGISKSYKLI